MHTTRCLLVLSTLLLFVVGYEWLADSWSQGGLVVNQPSRDLGEVSVGETTVGFEVVNPTSASGRIIGIAEG